ncbi:MAG TPA: hypothetical protein DCZ80_03145, partial [Legionellales bacterium]|nr:hypothetical protein [Legionellales bacterium]
ACFYLQIGWSIESPEDDLKRIENATDPTWLRAESLFVLREKIQSLDHAEKKQHLEKIYQAVLDPRATFKSVTQACTTEDTKKALGIHRFFKVSEKTSSETLVEQILENESIIKANRAEMQKCSAAKKHKKTEPPSFPGESGELCIPCSRYFDPNKPFKLDK